MGERIQSAEPGVAESSEAHDSHEDNEGFVDDLGDKARVSGERRRGQFRF